MSPVPSRDTLKKKSDDTCKSLWLTSDCPLGENKIKKITSAHLFSWIFTYINQVAVMLRATAEQQLVSSNLQPTNLLFNHNTFNSDTTTTENGMHAL